MAKQGGPSEIGQISFGIVADPTQAVAGIRTVEAEAERSVVPIGAAGKAAGQKYSDGIVGGAVGAAKGFGKAIRGLTNVFGALALANFIPDIFRAGRGIGESIFGDGGRVGAENAAKRSEEIMQRVSDSRKKFLEEANKKKDVAHVDIEGYEKRAKEIESLEKQRDEAEKAVHRAEEVRDSIRRNPVGVRQATGIDPETAAMKIFEEAVKRVLALEEKIEALRSQNKAKVDNTTRALAEQEKVEARIIRAKELEARRESAQRPGLIDSVPSDISRIRALTEIGTRQTFVADPGSGEY